MSFDEWYEKHWPGSRNRFVAAATRREDQRLALIAWAAAKDFNPTNLLDLEYICELAERHLREHMIKDSWAERIARYRAKCRELVGEIPG